jgi:hypothetical protein
MKYIERKDNRNERKVIQRDKNKIKTKKIIKKKATENIYVKLNDIKNNK